MRLKVLWLTVLVGLISSIVPVAANANAPQPPAGPVFNQVQLKVLADNDFAVFMGNDQEVTRLFYQNNVSWYAQVEAIQTLDVYPISGETFIYIVPMGGNHYIPPGGGNGGEENWSGVLNNIPLLDYPGGEVAVSRSIQDDKDITHSGYLVFNNHLQSFTSSPDVIADGKYNVTLEDLQPASRNLIWSSAVRSSSPVIGPFLQHCTVACSGSRFTPSIPDGAWDFPDGTAVLFRYPLSNANLPVSPGDRSVTVTWKDPGAGGTVDDYLIEYKETSQPDSTFKVFGTVPGTARTSTVTGLTNGIAYTLRVTARNSAGEASSLGRSVVPTGTPSRPTNQAYAAGDQSVSIDFAAPDNDGGMAITNYAYSLDDGATWITRNPASITSPITIPNLTNGTTYNVRLRAINPFGAGPGSLPITVKAGITQVRTLTYEAGTLATVSGLPTGATLEAGNTFTVPAGPTRTNFTFTGWKEGSRLFVPGDTYTVGATNPTLTAQWVQNSLLGVNTTNGAAKVLTWNIAASQSIDVTVAAGLNNSVRIQIPDGALAPGTEVIFWRLLNDDLAKARINSSKDYFVNLAITWSIGDDVTTPKYVVDAAIPIVITLVNPTIVAGATAWQIVGDTAKVLGNATRDGELVIQFTEDPVITAANVPPIPAFSTPVPTADGYTVNITNYDVNYGWEDPTVNVGTVTISSTVGSTRALTVTGLNPGQSATITQRSSLNGIFQTGTVTGAAIAAAPAPAPQSDPAPAPEPAPVVIAPAPTESPTVSDTVSPTISPTVSPTISPEATASPEPTKSAVLPKPVVRSFALTGFKPGSAVMSSAMRKTLDGILGQVKNPTKVHCLGNTMGPTVLSRDAVLAKKRAMVVCDYIATKLPTPKVTLKGQTTTINSGLFRRTLVSFTN
jgi:uncharacterized repeat protein (TIGR02543 family)